MAILRVGKWILQGVNEEIPRISRLHKTKGLLPLSSSHREHNRAASDAVPSAAIRLSRLAALIILIATIVPLAGTALATGFDIHVQKPPKSQRSIAHLPLIFESFESNVGQAPRAFKFIAHAQNALVLISSDHIIVHESQRDSPLHGRNHRLAGDTIMRLIGANPKAVVEGQSPLTTRVNYFIGRDPSQWLKNVPTVADVLVRDAWPGVDVEYNRDAASTIGAIECSFIVRPGTDPSVIRLAFDGVDKIRARSAHALSLGSGIREVSFGSLHVMQDSAAGRHEIPASFLVKADSQTTSAGPYVTFKLGLHNSSRPLIIDPTLVYSTFIGGSGEANAGSPRFGTGDSVKAIALDAAGDEYVTGSTSSPDFPSTTSGFLDTCAGGEACNPAFVTKINGQTGQIIYSTFLCGSSGGNDGGSGDQGRGIAVDSSGDAYITGATFSTDFPTTAGAYVKTCNSTQNAFATKLSADGSTLVYSTMVFCAGAVGGANAISIDDAGDAYIAGNDDLNAFAAVLNSTESSITYSIKLASSYANAIAVSPSKKIFIGGRALDKDFPTTPNAYRHNCHSCASKNPAFISVLDPSLGSSLASLTYSTILGGSAFGDVVNGMAADPDGRVWAVGTAGKGSLHGKVKFGHKTCPAGACGPKAFVALIDPSKKEAESLVYSAVLAGNGSDMGNAIALDSTGTVYVGGSTSSTNFPTTVSAVQSSYAPCIGCGPYRTAAFVSVLTRGDHKLKYSTYLGGAQILPPTDSFGNYLSEFDAVNAVSVDILGIIHASGTTYSSAFPVTSDAHQNVCKACATLGSDAFITRIDPASPDSTSALQYSSFLGGSGPHSFGDAVNAIASDTSGAIYLAGTTASPDFPTTSDAFETSCAGCVTEAQQNFVSGGTAGFVAKFDPNAAPGNELVYATFLGTAVPPPPDSPPSASVTGIAIDSNGEAYVAGWTNSTTFPVTPSAFQSLNPKSADGKAVFFSKLDSTGSNLLYSTYLAGSFTDQPVGLAINAQGDALIAGYTSSKDFPITANAFQSTCVPCGAVYASTYGGFVSEIDPSASGASSLLYSSFLSGTSSTSIIGDSIGAVTTDASGDFVVTGITTSADFPITANAFESAPLIPFGGFVSVINPTAAGINGLKYSTWLAEVAESSAIQVDGQGDIFVGGYTNAPNLPVTSNAFQPSCPRKINCSSGFIIGLNPSAIPASQLIYGSFLGGASTTSSFPTGGIDIVRTLGLDALGRIYAAGQTLSNDFPISLNAAQQTCLACQNAGGGNAFLTVIDPTLSGSGAMVYSTFLGGSVADVATNLLVIGPGSVAVGGHTSSSNFPITSNALEPVCPACRNAAFPFLYLDNGDGFVTEFQF